MEGRFDFSKPVKLRSLDVKDKKLIDLLLDDSRQPRTQLAKKLRLSRDSVEYRIKRLEEDGVIKHFFPLINYERIGFLLFRVFFLFDERNQSRKTEFITYLNTRPEVYSVIEYSDRWDFEVLLLEKNILAFDDFLVDISTKFEDVILEKNKVEIIRRFTSESSTFSYPRINSKMEILERGAIIELDSLDKKLLSVLNKFPKESSYLLAKRLKTSSDTVLYRIKRLLKNGVIRKFSVLLDVAKLGLQWHTFTLSTSYFTKQHGAMLQEFVYQHPQVIHSAKALGGWDILMYILTSSPQEFHSVAFDLKKLFSNNVKSYDSWMAYKEHFVKPVPNIVLK